MRFYWRYKADLVIRDIGPLDSMNRVHSQNIPTDNAKDYDHISILIHQEGVSNCFTAEVGYWVYMG